ncbi:hypothetical protein AYP1020_p37 (plasmid) [Staphylococcus capitis subsp. capitis]|uniref:hypothetical protein n=1 Tax=Staphylococcus capitis TaxID=29388 RepID=UPI00064AE5CB|nr:hypothetical protein [Staphylococcus capitis]AKL93492.1 hypothetical protein AYP1020_p37 [Staphylococcus capitis subsp. capitis]
MKYEKEEIIEDIKRNLKETKYHYKAAYGDNYLSEHVKRKHEVVFEDELDNLKGFLMTYPSQAADYFIEKYLKDE